jgi:hypothetical protein
LQQGLLRCPVLTIENDLYVVIRELGSADAPQPRPGASGFSENVAYRVLGAHCASETSEAYLILSNDCDEIWFISNRHLRTQGVYPDSVRLRFPLKGMKDADVRGKGMESPRNQAAS